MDVCDINCSTNTIIYNCDYAEVQKILALINNLQEQEESYLNAPVLNINKLEKYKLLSEYNNVILASCKVSSINQTMQKVDSIQYVTWERDSYDNGVQTGHYFADDYVAAKEDFAKHSGLVRKDMIFSETELNALYSGLVKLEAFDVDNDTNEVTKALQSVKSKISNIIPHIDEKIYEKDPQFKENEKFIAVNFANTATSKELDEEAQEDYVLEASN